MFDSPRPANAMPDSPNGTAPRFAVTARARWFAAAALLPVTAMPLHAAAKAAHHPAVHVAAARHGAVVRETPRGHAAPTRKHAEIARAETEHDRKAGNSRKPLVSMRMGDEPVKAARATPAAPKAAAVREAAAPAESAEDRAVQDRVHAWYRSRGLAGPNDAVAAGDNAAKPVAAVAPKSARAVKAVAPAAEPDLSLVPRKATVDDFDRAVQQRNEAIRAAALQNQSRTTADDDAAEASTQIPRTAPTARVSAPFTHGDLLQAAAPAAAAGAMTATATDFTPAPATLTVKPDAPKKFNNKPDAAALADTTTPVEGTKPQPIRIVAAETASVPAPKLTLPKPAPIVRQAPAVAAVKAAAGKQTIDPETVQDMTADTFSDGDDDAPPVVKVSPRAAKPVVAKVADDGFDDLPSAPASKVELYDGRGHLNLLPPMKGTHEILVHQNQMAVADGLDRIADDDQLDDMRRLKLLVALPDNDAIQVNEPLPANRRYARPWTVRFLNDLSRAHYARFHTPLVITSAVRTVAFQRRLVLTNGNAAPPTGDVASPHLYGQAVDLGKHGMSVTEVAWMRAYLTPVESAGKIDVEEEFQQACFHISVYRRYLGLPARKSAPVPDAVPERTNTVVVQAKTTPSRRRHSAAALLATGLR